MAGRPSLYSPELADHICDQIAEGKTLLEICKRKGMPDRATVTRWLLKRPDFAAVYTRAREDQGDYEHDQIKELEADVLAGKIPPDVARVVIGSKQWRAARLNRRHYSETKIIAGDAANPLNVVTTRKIDISGLSEEQLDVLEGALAQTLLTIEHEPTPVSEGDAEKR